jgi:steroid delta-isomerase-like uncharacterized protein
MMHPPRRHGAWWSCPTSRCSGRGLRACAYREIVSRATGHSKMTDNARTLMEFMASVWDEGDAAAVDRFLADEYVIHSDPGDPWEGATLSREGFKERLRTSRAPFPDLRFEIVETVAEGDRVTIAWRMLGTHTGPMGPFPPTGRRIAALGMTVYYFREGRITGHRQVVDRLAVAQQLGLASTGGPAGAERQ